MLLNSGAGEDSWEFLGQQADQASQSYRKSTLNIHWKTDAEAEAPILWPANAKSQLIRKDPDARKDWRQEEKEMTEDETVGWHHWFKGHEFKQTPGDSEGKPGILQSMGSQKVRHNWASEQQQHMKRDEIYKILIQINICNWLQTYFQPQWSKLYTPQNISFFILMGLY